MSGSTTKKAAAADATTTHYYGSTMFNWACAQTRAEVLAKLARATGAGTIKANLPHGGLYAWTCEVPLPQTAPYRIDRYAPDGVPYVNVREYNIINIKGHCTPIDWES